MNTVQHTFLAVLLKPTPLPTLETTMTRDLFFKHCISWLRKEYNLKDKDLYESLLKYIIEGI